MTFYRYMLSGMQEEIENDFTDCINAFTEYTERFNFIQDYTASNVAYFNGRGEKGNGIGSTAGYIMNMITMYMDVTVLMTNLYN